MTPSEQSYQCPHCGTCCPCINTSKLLPEDDTSARLIALSKGLFSIVSAEDFEELSRWKWCSSDSYAARRMKLPNGKVATVKMHRQVLGLGFGDKLIGDHINGNSLDNRRSNLRICQTKQNTWNRRIVPKNPSKLRGVTVGVPYGFRAQIQVNGKNIYLGTRSTAQAAHELYKAASIKYFGEYSPFL